MRYRLSYLLFLLLIAVSTFALSCKKDASEDPQCAVEKSIPISIEVDRDTSGDYVQQFLYDKLNRVVRINSSGSLSNVEEISYRGLDTALSVITYSSLIQTGFRTFDTNGNHLTSNYLAIGTSGDTIAVIQFGYTYDTYNQRTKVIRQGREYSSGRYVNTSYDTTTYEWEDGNIVRARNSDFGAFTLEYEPNTNGSFNYNMPEGLRFQNDRQTIKRQKFSKNLVRKIRYSSGETNFSYSTDASGRVRTMRVQCTGKTIENQRNTLYTLHYDCIK